MRDLNSCSSGIGSGIFPSLSYLVWSSYHFWISILIKSSISSESLFWSSFYSSSSIMNAVKSESFIWNLYWSSSSNGKYLDLACGIKPAATFSYYSLLTNVLPSWFFEITICLYCMLLSSSTMYSGNDWSRTSASSPITSLTFSKLCFILSYSSSILSIFNFC